MCYLLVQNICKSDDNIWVANLGDSRAVISKKLGREFKNLSRDHKPDDKLEKERIEQAGGNTYK